MAQNRPFLYGSEKVLGKPGLYELQAAFLGRQPLIYTIEDGETINVMVSSIMPPLGEQHSWQLMGWVEAIGKLVCIEHGKSDDGRACIAQEQVLSLLPVSSQPQRIVSGPGRLDLANAIVRQQPLEFELRSINRQPNYAKRQLAMRAIHATVHPNVWQIEATYAGEHADIENFVLQYNDAIRSGWLHNEC